MVPAEVANTPLVLVVRDGWGKNPNREHDRFNAISLAKTPVADHLGAMWPATLIRTCGEDVGLAVGTMGNSEVGHQNIGAGRIVDQEIMRITCAIQNASFFRNEALCGALVHARKNRSNFHVMGLVSDGRVHSDLEHLFAIIDLARLNDFPADRFFIHCFTDGRDTGPRTGLQFIERLEHKLDEAQVGRIASVCGRYFAMDRDHRWNRVALAYACLTGRGGGAADSAETSGVTIGAAGNALDAVRAYYDKPIEPNRAGDEFITPTQILGEDDRPLAFISPGDSVVFFNFRGDRPRELTRAFMLDDDQWDQVKDGGFDRGSRIDNLYFCAMTEYEQGLEVSAVAFKRPPKMQHILGQTIADAGLAQLRCAETEKYAHVTFFFNDYREEPFGNEQRTLIASPRDVSTYDQKPEMSARGVCDAILERLAATDCEPFIVVNFANADMVGHTGSLETTIRAVEVVDECVGRIVDAAIARSGSLIITADHGNAEQMWNPEQDCPHTAHTTFNVPLYIVGEAFKNAQLRSGGRLADIAPTALAMMGLAQPEAMTGISLL